MRSFEKKNENNRDTLGELVFNEYVFLFSSLFDICCMVHVRRIMSWNMFEGNILNIGYPMKCHIVIHISVCGAGEGCFNRNPEGNIFRKTLYKKPNDDEPDYDFVLREWNDWPPHSWTWPPNIWLCEGVFIFVWLLVQGRHRQVITFLLIQETYMACFVFTRFLSILIPF